MTLTMPRLMTALICACTLSFASYPAHAVPQNPDDWAKNMEAAFRTGKLITIGKLMDQAVDDHDPGEAKRAHQIIADNIRMMVESFGKEGPGCAELFDTRRIGSFFRRYDFAVCNGTERIFFRFDLVRREKLGWLLRSWQASENLDKIVNAPLPGNANYDRE
ncbi:hypothetical protein [Granulibacter bethesdensis]|uniref:hypothetical protein n=1 Tax=Granulibacter bethesdensis TaxID=364410 RepID=UPI00090C9487|nr:hypothetical protein [Granulibacter bethesdensis]APH60671.1 putative secreted protein [Granulibacter bethesdensis]